MIVGSTLKAKKCSLKPSPKTNAAPASLNESSLVTTSVRPAKKIRPHSVRRMITAKTSCSRVPVITARQGTLRRLLDSAQAIRSRTSIPKRDTNRTRASFDETEPKFCRGRLPEPARKGKVASPLLASPLQLNLVQFVRPSLRSTSESPELGHQPRGGTA